MPNRNNNVEEAMDEKDYMDMPSKKAKREYKPPKPIKYAVLLDENLDDLSEYDFDIPEASYYEEVQLEAFKKQAKRMHLDNETAKKLLCVGRENILMQQDMHKKLVKKWAEEIQMDRQMGGVALERTIANARACMARFDADGKVMELLNQTGYGNHPEIMRFLASVGQAYAEDRTVMGHVKQKRPLHERLYKKNY